MKPSLGRIIAGHQRFFSVGSAALGVRVDETDFQLVVTGPNPQFFLQGGYADWTSWGRVVTTPAIEVDGVRVVALPERIAVAWATAHAVVAQRCSVQHLERRLATVRDLVAAGHRDDVAATFGGLHKLPSLEFLLEYHANMVLAGPWPDQGYFTRNKATRTSS